MIENLPVYTYAVFALATMAAALLLYKASGFSRSVLYSIGAWLLLQGLIAASGFYTVTNSIPSRFILAVLPTVVALLALFGTSGGKAFLSTLHLKTLTWIHAVRVPVELVLLWLYFDKLVPRSMTFEGQNFDILSGLSAPLIVWICFGAKKLNRSLLIAWNLICLALLFSIVVTAFLALPGPVQQIDSDQPNTAVLYFPVIWLPSFIVPVVFLRTWPHSVNC